MGWEDMKLWRKVGVYDVQYEESHEVWWFVEMSGACSGLADNMVKYP